MTLELQIPRSATLREIVEFIRKKGIETSYELIPELEGHILFELVLSPDTLKKAVTGIRVSGFNTPNGCTQALANGWQCWSESPILKSNETLFQDVKADRKVFGDAEFYPYAEKPGQFHSWGYSYGNSEKSDGAPFWGSLTEFTAHSAFEFQLGEGTFGIFVDTEGLSTEKEITLKWILPNPEAQKYAPLTQSQAIWIQKLTNTQSVPTVNQNKIFGYTSWYYTYTDISEDLLKQRLNAIKSQEAPWEVFQVDDGFSTAIGDWITTKYNFPGGMDGVARAAKKSGKKPGLWCAPFIACENSQVFREHPEYFLKDIDGKMVLCGNQPLWGGKFYALDTEQPEVKKHLESVVQTYFQKWGFSFLKADFIYATSRVATGGLSRAQRGRNAMLWLWEMCQKYDVTLLACGSILSTSVGVCDYCRVGADVDLFFTPQENPQWDLSTPMREIPSTVGTLTNTITRSTLNGLSFGNDPDVFILRDEAQHMTHEQRKVIYDVNKLFGNLLFCSDNPATFKDWQTDVMQQKEPTVKIKETLSITKQQDNAYKILVKDFEDKTKLITVNLTQSESMGTKPYSVLLEEI